MSSLVPMVTGSTMPGLRAQPENRSSTGRVGDYRLATEPAWGGEHRKLMGALLYKKWKRDNTAAYPWPTGYSGLSQLVTWASISIQSPLGCQS